MTTKAEAAERRESIVTLLERKELMSAKDIGEQLGIAKMSLLNDIRILIDEKRLAREGTSHNIQYRLASATRRKKSNGHGHAKESSRDAAPPGDVSAPPAPPKTLLEQLMALAARKRGELLGIEEAIVIALRAG